MNFVLHRMSLPICFVCLLRLELVRNLLELFCRLNIDNSSNLSGVSHQLLGAGIKHSNLGIACNGEVEEEHIWYR